MSYAVGGVSRTEVVEYVIEGRVPLAVSARGVREKLGVSPQDLPDEEIDLVGAYWEMQSLADLGAYENVETSTSYVVANGIEALAGLAVLDTLQVRVATMESSGTNEYQRLKIGRASCREKVVQ